MTRDAEQGDSKPPPHGNSGEGTASILPHLSSPDQQPPQAQVSKLDAPPADDNAAGPV